MKWKVGDILEYKPHYNYPKHNYVIIDISGNIVLIKDTSSSRNYSDSHTFNYLSHYLQLKRPPCPVKRELSRVNLP